MMSDDNDGQMIVGDLGGLKLLDICLTGEKKPRKKLTQETRARYVTGAHAAACPTAVDTTCQITRPNSTDFFEFVMDQVYRTPVRDLADLQERIYVAVQGRIYGGGRTGPNPLQKAKKNKNKKKIIKNK